MRSWIFSCDALRVARRILYKAEFRYIRVCIKQTYFLRAFHRDQVYLFALKEIHIKSVTVGVIGQLLN